MTDADLETRIIEDAYREACRVVQDCRSPGGMKASAAEPGYPQVWSRDTMITLLGAVLIGDIIIFLMTSIALTVIIMVEFGRLSGAFKKSCGAEVSNAER